MTDPILDDALIQDLLDGHTPDEATLQRLIQALERDPRALEELKSLLTVEDLLAQRGREDRSEQAFTSSLRLRLDAESDSHRFVSETADLIRRDSVLRRPRRHLPGRLLKLRRQTSGQFWALAAMLLIGVGVAIGFLAGLAVDSGDEPGGSSPVATVQEPRRTPSQPVMPAPQTVPTPIVDQAPLPQDSEPGDLQPPPALAEASPAPVPAPIPQVDPAPAPATPVTAPALARVVESGGVRLFRNGIGMDAADQMLVAGDLLMSGSEPGSRAVIRYEDGTRAELSPDSTCEILAGRNGSKQFNLRSGTLHFAVVKQPMGAPFRVETPEGAFRVVGTVFTVERGQGQSRLTVEEGAVHATRRLDNKGLTVRAGFTTLVSDLEPMVIRPIETHEPVATQLPTAPIDEKTVRITRFTLINCANGRPLAGYESLTDGQTIDVARLPTRRFTLFVETHPPEVNRVIFDLNGQKEFRREIMPPYSLTTNDPGTNFYRPWEPALGEPHTLTVTPYTGTPNALVAGQPTTIRLRFVDSAVRP